MSMDFNSVNVLEISQVFGDPSETEKQQEIAMSLGKEGLEAIARSDRKLYEKVAALRASSRQQSGQGPANRHGGIPYSMVGGVSADGGLIFRGPKE